MANTVPGAVIRQTWEVTLTSATVVANRFIKYDGSGYAGPTDANLGVSIDGGVSGQKITTVIDGEFPVTAGSNGVAAGDDLICDANGNVVTATALALSGGSGSAQTLVGTTLPARRVGKALTTALVGELCLVALAR